MKVNDAITAALINVDKEVFVKSYNRATGRKPWLSIQKMIEFIRWQVADEIEKEFPDIKNWKTGDKIVKKWLGTDDAKMFINFGEHQKRTNSDKLQTIKWARIKNWDELPIKGSDEATAKKIVSIANTGQYHIRTWYKAAIDAKDGNDAFNSKTKKARRIKDEIEAAGWECRSKFGLPSCVVKKFDNGKYLFAMQYEWSFGHFENEEFVVEMEGK